MYLWYICIYYDDSLYHTIHYITILYHNRLYNISHIMHIWYYRAGPPPGARRRAHGAGGIYLFIFNFTVYVDVCFLLPVFCFFVYLCFDVYIYSSTQTQNCRPIPARAKFPDLGFPHRRRCFFCESVGCNPARGKGMPLGIPFPRWDYTQYSRTKRPPPVRDA